jgi:quercetin dioxygenase-like cupin family protein
VIALVVALIAPAFAQKAESEAVNAKWIEFFNKGDFAGIASLYTDDAVAFPPGSAIVKCRAASRQCGRAWRSRSAIRSSQRFGDPTKPGVYVQRTKFPPGTKVMPHWHPDEWRTAVVLSGTLYFGVGEQCDESKLRAYPAGTFYSEPPKTPHFVWAKDGEVIIQTTGMGPTGTNMIPQKQ